MKTVAIAMYARSTQRQRRDGSRPSGKSMSGSGISTISSDHPGASATAMRDSGKER